MRDIKPSLNEFEKLAGKGNLIPVYTELVADTDTPVSSYMKLIADITGNNSNFSFLLESVEGGENIGRYSLLGANPASVFIQEDGNAVLKTDKFEEKIEGKDVFEKIQKVMDRYHPVENESLPPFVGGAVGYVSYDVISEVEKTVPVPDDVPVNVPEALFMITDSIIVFDRVKHTIMIICQAHLNENYEASEVYKKATEKVANFAEKLKTPAVSQSATMRTPSGIKDIKSNKTAEEYREIVRKSKKYILEGDIIQAVLSQRFETDMPYSPLAVHRALRMVNPSPYMFLLDCGDFSIVGASPEVHAKCEDGEITVRPIAGTRKRGADKKTDDALAEELLADPKERAEHIMLVDLARNDIGRVAETGSINVDQLMVIEKYSHVMHIVSNVKGKLKKGLKADSVMRSTFPAGTLSGAPKVRAMQIISEFEKEKRGPYGGAVAYYSFNGNLNSAITIRTAVLKDGKAYIQAGAGLVADSDPQKEYEECQNKARGMLKALSLAGIFDFS